ncbi:esterase [Comamonadaceae bacterium G21597-S1]|nr:esterase [Comamonadaceae bacterium G21597-S1]
MQSDLIIQQPEEPRSRPAELVLLFHGAGSSAEDLRPLGELLARAFRHAWIVSVRSPLASELGGWQWFSVQGVTENNRPVRVAAAMPQFVQSVAHWQRASGVEAAATTLIGFSQGAIMVLEATQQPECDVGRVIAIAGRFAQTPRVAPPRTELNLLHGDADRVMPVALAEDAAASLQALGARATLDRFAGLGHGIDSRVAQRIVGLSSQRARPEAA